MNVNVEWKDVVGYEGLYEVNNLGEVFSLGRVVYDSIGRTRNIKPKKLNPSANASGYLEVRLTNELGESKKHLIHRVVASAFIDNPMNKEFVNHTLTVLPSCAKWLKNKAIPTRASRPQWLSG